MKLKKHFWLSLAACLMAISSSNATFSSHLSGWYPVEGSKLQEKIASMLSYAHKHFPLPAKAGKVRAILVPHAGYHYSGLCAATAFKEIKQGEFRRIIILAPSHFAPFDGIAIPSFENYQTPLGLVKIDDAAIKILDENPTIFHHRNDVFEVEHAIEVQLPFLQETAGNFELVPLIVGHVNSQSLKTIALALKKIINEKTLIIVSSDLTHYGKNYNYQPTQKNIHKTIMDFDNKTLQALFKQSLTAFDAALATTKSTVCGQNPLRIFLALDETHALGDLKSWLCCYYTSAHKSDPLPPKPNSLLTPLPDVRLKNFVTYASIVWTEKKELPAFKDQITGFEKEALLLLARSTVAEKLNKKTDPMLFIKSPGLMLPAGSFVTLYKPFHQLRGCIGTIITNDPLFKTVKNMALAAAFNDSRFKPLTEKELPEVIMNISILEKPTDIADPSKIELGKEGIIFSKNTKRGIAQSLFLPKVATEQGWNTQQTLEALAEKAGLAKNDWRGGSFKVFPAEEFEEQV